MKFMKFTSIIALQALTACGGSSESDVEGTGTPSLATSTQRPYSEQQTSHTGRQDVTEQMNSTPVASLYTEQQVDHVNGQDEQQASEPQNVYPAQGSHQVWNRYVNRVKHTVTQNVMDRFKTKTLLLTYPTNTTKQLDSALAIAPNAEQQETQHTQNLTQLPPLTPNSNPSETHGEATLPTGEEQQINYTDSQHKQDLIERNATTQAQKPQQEWGHSNKRPITPPSEEQQTNHTDSQYKQDLIEHNDTAQAHNSPQDRRHRNKRPITPPGEEQLANHMDSQQKKDESESSGNQVTSLRSPSFSDQSYALDVGSDELQNIAQQQNSRVYTNNAIDINAAAERKILENINKLAIIPTNEEKSPKIPVQELLNENNKHSDFKDAKILFIFTSNNETGDILSKDDENNWYIIQNSSKKILKLQEDHKNWLELNISDTEETKITYFTQSQLDSIKPMTEAELSESLGSFLKELDQSTDVEKSGSTDEANGLGFPPVQADQSTMDILNELTSASLYVEKSSLAEEAKWVRVFIEGIFLSEELLTNMRINTLIKNIKQAYSARKISDETKSYIDNSIGAIIDCETTDQSYKAMVYNRRTNLYKTLGMIKSNNTHALEIDPIIYKSIISFYEGYYPVFLYQKEDSFDEIESNKPTKRAITNQWGLEMISYK